MPSTQYYLYTRVLELHGSSPYSLSYARQPNDLADYTNDEAVIESDQYRQHRLAFLNTIVYPTILEKVNKKHIQRNEKFIASHRMLKGDYPTGSQVLIRDEMRADAPSRNLKRWDHDQTLKWHGQDKRKLFDLTSQPRVQG